MIRRSSVLGRALEGQKALGSRLLGYGALLDKIDASDQAAPEFDRLVTRVKPASVERLAGELLYEVIMTALEAGKAAPKVASRSRSGSVTSALVEERLAIEARYEQLLGAIDLLEGAFAMPSMRVVPQPESGPTSGERVSASGFVPEDDAATRLAMEEWRGVLTGEEPSSQDARALAWRDRLRFRTQDAPQALKAMRSYFNDTRSGLLASLSEFPGSRNQGRGADRRAFTVMLSGRLKDLVGGPEHDFVTTMTTILFGSDDDDHTLAGTQRLVGRHTKKKAAGGH